VTTLIEFIRRHAGNNVWGDHVEHVGRQTPGHAHLILFSRSFDSHLHGFDK
jgi:hypothetical protein